MSAYLNADELADMIDCEPNQFACMKRWLDKNGWPYQVSIRGMPKVSREYHKSRMAGAADGATDAANADDGFDFTRFARA